VSLADTITGATIALVSSVGTQVLIGWRAARETRRQSRFSSMLEIHEGMTELYALVLDFAKRKREAGGVNPGGAVELMTRRFQLRLHLEMLDDDKVREIADNTLNTLASLARGMAPDPGEQEVTRQQTDADLKAATKGLEDLAARIGEVARAEQRPHRRRRARDHHTLNI
jgi:hypothetical protein